MSYRRVTAPPGIFILPTMAFQCTCASCGNLYVLPLPIGSADWRCASCLARARATAVPATQTGPDWGQVLLWGGGLLAAYKFVVQPLLDEEYEGRTLPASVRERLKAEHIAQHGSRCLHCGVRTAWGDLVIDHIYAYALGGRTSIQNSQVMCRWCNGDKSDRMDVFDMLRGRGGREW